MTIPTVCDENGSLGADRPEGAKNYPGELKTAALEDAVT
jgi:hypothetical protein